MNATPILFVVIIKTNITLSVMTHPMATKLSLMVVMDRPIRPTLSTLAGGHSRYSGGHGPLPPLATALHMPPPYASGHISATGDPIHFMFCSRVGLSGTADLMALFSIRINSRWRWRRPPSWIISNGHISATAHDLLI